MTALVVTVAGESSHSSESMSTLQFGSRAKLISVKATVNEVVDYKAMYLALQARLDEGVDSSTGLTIQVQSLEAKLAALQREADDAKRVSVPSLCLFLAVGTSLALNARACVCCVFVCVRACVLVQVC